MRIRDPNLLRLLHFEWDECVICGVTQPLHLHHVLFRSQGGDDIRANLLMLCVDCHHGYHTRRGDGFGLRLTQYIRDNRPDTQQYLAKKLGAGGAQVWFAVHQIGYSEQ